MIIDQAAALIALDKKLCSQQQTTVYFLLFQENKA